MPDNNDAGPLYFNPLQIGGVHWPTCHGRWADPDVVIKRVDLVAGETAHREDGRSAGGIAAGYTGRSFCDVGCRPETAVLDDLLVDNLDCRWGLACCKAEREPTSVMTFVSSGVWVVRPPVVAGIATAVCGRGRPAIRAGARLRCVPGSARRTGFCCGGDTTIGPRSGLFPACGTVCAIPASIDPEARKARRPSGATDVCKYRLNATPRR